MIKRLGVYALPAMLALGASFPARALDIAILQGWNLVSNPGATPIDIAATFGTINAPVAGITENVQTVWAWDSANRNWAFYTPAQADGGAAYAASKGYEMLSSAPVGQGFWINAGAAFTLTLGASVPGSSVASYEGSYSGTYSGTATLLGHTVSDHGTWQATVSALGAVTGTVHSDTLGIDFSGSGSLSSDGATTVTFSSGSLSATLSGTANAFTGAFSGNWTNANFSASFTGTKQ